MTIHTPAYYRDLLVQIEEAIKLEEARFDTLKQIYVPKLDQQANSIAVPADVEAQLRTTAGESVGEKLFNWIASQDPGKNYPATQWMLDRVLRKQNPMPLEDVMYARETLEKFNNAVRNKALPPDHSTDLNQYKSLSDVEQAIIGGQQAAQDVDRRDLEKATKESEILYNGSDITVVSPLTEFASNFWGQPTGWCTAWGDHLKVGLSKQGRYPTRSNRFEYYNSNGPLYIVINKRNPEERYQFHYGYNQFMDKDDKPIEPKNIADKFPILWKIFQPIAEQNKSFILNSNPSEETKEHVIRKDPKQIKHLKDPSPELQLLAAKSYRTVATEIKNPIKEVQLIAVQANPLSLIKIAKNLGKDPNEDIQLEAVKRDGLAITAIENPSEAVQLAAVQENGDAIRYIIDNLGKNPSTNVQKAAVYNAYDALMWFDKPSEEIALYAIEQHKNSPWAVSMIADILAEKNASTARTNDLIKRYERD